MKKGEIKICTGLSDRMTKKAYHPQLHKDFASSQKLTTRRHEHRSKLRDDPGTDLLLL